MSNFSKKIQGNFKEFCNENNLLVEVQTILLAFSGGVDSVVLLDLFRACFPNLSITALHCNFQLRGRESDEDEQFVRSLANRYQIEILTQRFETERTAKENGVSIQMAARSLRYEWFDQQQNRKEFAAIATAHHATDQLETLVFNLAKGTDVSGLRGMLPKDASRIKPLLFLSKENIIQYAEENKLKWREDSSNAKSDYARNKIRHKVLPILREINPSVDTGAFEITEKLKRVEEVYFESLPSVKEGEGTSFKISLEDKVKPVDYYYLLKRFGFNYQELKKILKEPLQTGRQIINNQYILTLDRNSFLIEENKGEKSVREYILERKNQKIELDKYQSLELAIYPLSSSPDYNNLQIAYLDSTKITYPLIARKWKKGDKFQPFGMKFQKKLSDFFIDNKVSLVDKKKLWVITDANNKIIWVSGYRIDDKHKITASTEKVCELRLIKKN